MSGRDPAGAGCCDDGSAPVAVWNRPGLSQVAYRIASHGSFKASMLARLSAADLPALAPLTRRDDADPAIALLDTAATLGDILTFYQERIANESWLRTATERRSLVAMARLIGYEPAPGLAASAHLAFTLEDADPTLEQLAIPAGTRVQSVPPPGAQAVVFETIEDIVARPEWNAIRPLLRQPHPPLSAATDQLLVQGARPEIQAGETVLLVFGATQADRAVKRVIRAELDTAAQTTRLDLAEAPVSPPPLTLPVLELGLFQLRLQPLTNASLAQNVLGRLWQLPDLDAYARVQRWTPISMRRNLKTQRDQRSLPPEMGAHRFRRVASIFGHNAPQWSSLGAAQRYGQVVQDQNGKDQKVPPAWPDDWDSAGYDTLADDVRASGLQATIDLDDRVTEAVPCGWAVLATGTSTPLAANITAAEDVARSDFTLNAKVTRLGLDDDTGFSSMRRRDVSVQVASEALPLADIPVDDTVEGNSIVLDDAYLGLQPNRPIAVSGRRADLDGVDAAEIAWIADIALADGLTVLTLRSALVNPYVRASVAINANVALSTHGQSQAEAIGSGDARQPFQRFPLRHPPLTYVPDTSSAGAKPTLQIRVNQERWKQVPDLFSAGPDDKVFIAYANDAGGTVVQFGDGGNGALLPGGLENVQASYRQGIGTAGLVAAGTLSLPLVRPAGVRAVTNPAPARDAADPDGPDMLRANAALRIKTLDRVVSLQDYEDFARAFGGIGKALASWTWSGAVRGVFLTVSGPDGLAVDPDGLVATGLARALRDAGDGRVPLRIASYRPAFFRIDGRLRVDPALDADVVGAAVETALRAAFGFATRQFGAPVSQSEVLAAIHAVAGVIAFDADLFARSEGGTGVADLLTAAAPRPGEANPDAAELLLLDPRPIRFGSLA